MAAPLKESMTTCSDLNPHVRTNHPPSSGYSEVIKMVLGTASVSSKVGWKNKCPIWVEWRTLITCKYEGSVIICNYLEKFSRHRYNVLTWKSKEKHTFALTLSSGSLCSGHTTTSTHRLLRRNVSFTIN